MRKLKDRKSLSADLFPLFLAKGQSSTRVLTNPFSPIIFTVVSPYIVCGLEGMLRMFSSAGQLCSGVKQENASYNLVDVKFEAGTGECGELLAQLEPHPDRGNGETEENPNKACSHIITSEQQ